MASAAEELVRALSPEALRALAERFRDRDGIRRLPGGRAAYESSFAQQRLWFLDRLHPGATAYNVPVVLQISGMLDAGCLRRALNEIVRRHEILRTVIAADDSSLHQVVRQQLTLDLPVVDAASNDVRPLVEEALRMPFDLEQGPLIRATLLRVADEEHVLALVLHHIVADGWSLGVFVREVAALYGGAVLPELPLQYVDYAAWQREMAHGPAFDRQLDYWRRQLRGAPPALDFLPDRARSEAQSFRGAHERALPGAGLSQAVRRLCAAEDLTPFMVLLAVFVAVLHRHTGETDICIGSPVAGRRTPALEPLIGFFVNTLVLRCDLTGDPSFRELLRRIRRTALDAFDHQDVPFERLVEELGPARTLKHAPLFQIEFTVQNMPLPPLDLGGLVLTPMQVESGAARFDLTLQVIERNDVFEMELEYATDLFEPGTIQALSDQLVRVAAAAIDDPGIRLSRLPLIGAREEATLQAWNETRVERDGTPLHRLIERQADQTPDAVAVTCDGIALTCAQLDRAANRIANRLVRAGAGPDRVVAVMMDRSPAMVAAILGVMKAGAAYLPIDPGAPRQRASLMLAEAEAVVTLIDASGAASVPQEAQSLMVDLSANGDDRRVPATPDAANLAYVIYTSGSTGRPKGVMNTHGALANRIHWMQEAYHLDASDRVLQKTPFTFDVSVWEILWPLTSGARLVLARAGAHTDSAYLVETIASHGITATHFVPSLLRLFLEERDVERCRSLRLMLCSGEALTPVLRDAVVARLGCRLENLYGPTEAAIDVTSWTCVDGPIAIGRPIANARTYILDRHLRAVPRGATGDLHIGGEVLARGYSSRPDLTAAAFIPDPWGNFGERMYATGDRARFRSDGNIEYLGRADAQLKVHGIRIEPEEIEAQLCRHPAVRDAAVAAQADSRGELRLVAHVVPAGDLPAAGDLRDFLAVSLPASLVPGVFHLVSVLPRTASGKIDRSALAGATLVSGTAPETEPPASVLEARLAAIWRELLQVETIGRRDDFFELGGHSLLAIRLVGRIRKEFGVVLALRELFQSRSVSALAAAIDAGMPQTAGQGNAGIVTDVANRFEPFPLNDVQEAYWIGRRGEFELGNVAAHLYVEIDCRGIEASQLNAALNHVIRRHDMLRCIVDPDGRQRILRTVPDYAIRVAGLRDAAAAAVDDALARTRAEMSHQILPSDRWPLFDIRATRLDAERTRMHMSLDLLIGDALSWLIMCREIAMLARHPEVTLPDLSLSFRDYVLFQRTLSDREERRRALAYWDARLDSIPPAPELPALRSGPMHEMTFQRRSGKMSPEQWKGLRGMAVAAGVTPSVLLMAAFAEVLALWSAKRQFTLNVTLFNRLDVHAEVDDIVGDFTSLTLLEIDGGGATFAERARRIQAQLWDDLDHREVGGIEVLRRMARRRGEPPVMPVVFSSILPQLGRGEDTSVLRQLGDLVYGVTQTPQIYLDHQVYEQDGALRFNWDSVDELFPDGMWAAMFESYERLLETLAGDAASWQLAQPASIPSTHLELIESVNRTDGPVSDSTLHSLFETTARRWPDAMAVIGSDRSLTYRRLDAESNHMARMLPAGELIAVVLPPSCEQAVATLAIMKSGSAYLPIDHDLPQHRLRHLLARGGVTIALTDPAADANMEWPEGLRRIRVDDAVRGSIDGTAMPSAQRPDDLAYVMFTSGSTGEPKGVEITHRGAVNTILEVNARFGIGGSDRVLAVSRLTFDLSVYDLFGTFAAGGAVVVPDRLEAKDPAHWAERARRDGVTVWSSAPPLASMLVDHLEARGETLGDELRLVMLSGDWIPVDLPARIRALAPRSRVISLGGATEASIWSIFHAIDRVEPSWTSIPYGRPLTNQRIYVLAGNGAPRPLFVPGEIFIGGIGLARGYWRDEEQTRARFVTNAFTGQRLYATGDLGRLLPGGDVEFLGRLDTQVKIRGHRVELGEIESVLRTHEAVHDVAVVARGSRHARELAAFVVPRSGESLTSSAVRDYLCQRLPPYMVPASLSITAALPLNRNGKVDRAALSNVEAEPEVAHVPGESAPLESRIASWVGAIIGIPDVDPGASLFDLGVNSVDIVKIANLIWKNLRVQIRFTDFYRDPTVRSLARACGEPSRAQDIMLDLEERDAFKRGRHGLRDFPAFAPRLWLPPSSAADNMAGDRRSHRRFGAYAVPFDDFGRLIACLRQTSEHGVPRFHYPSAGGLYPIQTYLHVKPGRVERVGGGSYYYDPVQHTLVLLHDRADFDAEAHDPLVNRPIFESAAFSIFLIARREAIEPMYRDASDRFCLLEAGYIGQLLMMTSAHHGLGLCPIGDLEFERVRDLFDLEDGHRLVHSFVGGVPDSTADRDEGIL